MCADGIARVASRTYVCVCVCRIETQFYYRLSRESRGELSAHTTHTKKEKNNNDVGQLGCCCCCYSYSYTQIDSNKRRNQSSQNNVVYDIYVPASPSQLKTLASHS